MKKFILGIVSLFLFSQVFAGTLTVYYPAITQCKKFYTRDYYSPVTYENVEFVGVTGNVAVFKINGKIKALSTEMIWEYND